MKVYALFSLLQRSSCDSERTNSLWPDEVKYQDVIIKSGQVVRDFVLPL